MSSIFVKPEQNGRKSTLLKPSFDSQRLWSRSETKLWTVTFFFGTCALYASRVSLPLCAVAMAKEYGWNKTDSGTILSCFFWGYAATQVIAGNVADLIGGERILPYSTFVWAMLTLFTPQLFDFAYWSGSPLFVLLLVRILTGVGQGFHLPSMASIISRHLTTVDKGRVFGICLAGSHFGSVVAGSIGSLLIEWLGWRSLFHFVGLLSLLWFFMFNRMRGLSLKRRKSHAILNATGREVEKEPLTENADLGEEEKREAGAAVPWGKLFKHPAFWAACVAQYCGANAYFTMFSWLPYYFSDNFPEAKALVYNVVPSLAIVFTSLFAPYMATKFIARGRSVTFTRRFMEGSSLLGMSLCLLLVSISSTFGSSLALFTLAMAVRGLHHGGVSVNASDFAPNQTGTVFGIFNAFSAVTGFIGVYVAGWILHASGNHWAYVFVFTAFQCLVGALVYGTLGTGNKII